MRKILFRGKAGNTWHYGDAHTDYKGVVSTIIVPAVCWDEKNIETQCAGYFGVDAKTIGQYVGIDDINGKHIYEGDILKIVSPNDDEDKPFVTGYYEIAYNEKQRAFVLRSDCGDEPFDFSQEEMNEYKVEVIGNIYENEDLRGKVYAKT